MADEETKEGTEQESPEVTGTEPVEVTSETTGTTQEAEATV